MKYFVFHTSFETEKNDGSLATFAVVLSSLEDSEVDIRDQLPAGAEITGQSYFEVTDMIRPQLLNFDGLRGRILAAIQDQDSFDEDLADEIIAMMKDEIS